MELNKAIEIAKAYLGNEYFDGLNISYELTDEPLKLKVVRNKKDIKITYSEKVCLFRGLTFVKEKANEESYEIDCTLRFRKNGLMLDVSRNGVVTIDKVKEFILIEALMGENRLLLYTEDTYEIKEHPYFGYLRGAYSKNDIKELVAYGEDFGVELLPTIQTLAHLATALRWEPIGDEVSDTDDCLLVNNEKTYKFIEDMIRTCRECYKSNEIHIGMDESFTMGLGKALRLYGFQDRVEMFCKHLARVIEICKKYDFKPMIWSDMFFRLNHPNQEYYTDQPIPDKYLNIIPRDVKLVYWDYYHSEKNLYKNMIQLHRLTKNEVCFAGGSWRWKGFAPAIDRSIQYSIEALNACVEEKLDDVFCTAWGDNGNECSFFSVLPVLALYSIAQYQGNTDLKLLDSLLKAVSNEPLDRMLLMDLPDVLTHRRKTPMHIAYNPSKYFLYQDVLLGYFDDQYKPAFKKDYKKHAEVLLQASKESERYGYVYKLLADLCDFLSIKCELGVSLRKAYKANDKKYLKVINGRIKRALKKLKTFENSLKTQWFTECRPFGYEILDGRLGWLRNRMESASQRVEDYLNGKIETIEELEKDILPFQGHDYEMCWNWWLRTVSPSNVN